MTNVSEGRTRVDLLRIQSPPSDQHDRFLDCWRNPLTSYADALCGGVPVHALARARTPASDKGMAQPPKDASPAALRDDRTAGTRLRFDHAGGVSHGDTSMIAPPR